MAKSNNPNPTKKGILANKNTATVKKGNNPSPVVRRKSGGKKMC